LFQAESAPKPFRPGLCPKPRWGAYAAPSDPLIGWGGGHPFLYTPTRSASRSRCLRASLLGPNTSFWLYAIAAWSRAPTDNFLATGQLFHLLNAVDWTVVFFVFCYCDKMFCRPSSLL